MVDTPPRYGQDQLLAIAVPVDEVEQPIIDIRNDTFLYSVAFLVFALPLYVTLVSSGSTEDSTAPRRGRDSRGRIGDTATSRSGCATTTVSTVTVFGLVASGSKT